MAFPKFNVFHRTYAESYRSDNDPWYGKGKHVAPDTFDHSPFGSTLVYFSSDSIKSLTPSSLTTVEQIEMEEGADEFPIRVFYVLQLKRGFSPV